MNVTKETLEELQEFSVSWVSMFVPLDFNVGIKKVSSGGVDYDKFAGEINLHDVNVRLDDNKVTISRMACSPPAQ